MSRAAGDHVVFDFHQAEEDGGRWIEEVECEAWLPALLPLRDELAGFLEISPHLITVAAERSAPLREWGQ